MAESFIHKNLADKRKEIQAYIGSLERDLEKARRDLSAIIVTEHVFQAKGPNVTAYMELSFLFPRHELPRLARAAMEANPDVIAAGAFSRLARRLQRCAYDWERNQQTLHGII
jgi:phage shock protein A